jgi:hypothetical protein
MCAMSFFGALSTQFGDLDGPNLDEVSQGVGWTDIVPSDPNDSANDRRLKDNYYNMKLFSTINSLKRLWALRYKNCQPRGGGGGGGGGGETKSEKTQQPGGGGGGGGGGGVGVA